MVPVQSSEFLRWRLLGTRFDDGEVPLAILDELIALRKMVFKVSERLLVDANRNPRRRVFKEVDLRLLRISGGSVSLEIGLASLAKDHAASSYEAVFKQARDSIIEWFISAGADNLPPGVYPDDLRTDLKSIARSLNRRESRELSAPSCPTPVRVTAESCRRMLDRPLAPHHKVILHGAVQEADQKRMSFELQLIGGSKVECPMPEAYRDVVLGAFDGYRSGAKVLVQGTDERAGRGKVRRLKSTSSIIPLDPLDVHAQLDEFRDMKDGWYEGSGLAPAHDGMDWLAVMFDRMYPGDAPLPHIYPTYDGGVRMEWNGGLRKRNSIVLEVDLRRHKGDWLFFNQESSDEHERELDLDAAEDWRWIVDQTRSKIMTGHE